MISFLLSLVADILFCVTFFFGGIVFVSWFISYALEDLDEIQANTEGRDREAVLAIRRGMRRIQQPLLQFSKIISSVYILGGVILFLFGSKDISKSANVGWDSVAFGILNTACIFLFFSLLFWLSNLILFYPKANRFFKRVIAHAKVAEEKGEEEAIALAIEDGKANPEGPSFYLFNQFLGSAEKAAWVIATGLAGLSGLIFILDTFL